MSRWEALSGHTPRPSDYILGSDECGYGSWAGPLVVCAALVSRDWPDAHLVKDSKALTAARRTAVCKQIIKTVLFAIESVKPPEIDAQGVYKAVLGAHQRAIAAVKAKHEESGCVGTIEIIVDGNLPIPGARSLPKADALIPAVSAASIIGKVARDRHMVKQAALYPGYGFEKHMGYGTPEHRAALERLGVCDLHRRSYAPIARLVAAREEPSIPLWELFGEEGSSPEGGGT